MQKVLGLQFISRQWSVLGETINYFVTRPVTLNSFITDVLSDSCDAQLSYGNAGRDWTDLLNLFWPDRLGEGGESSWLQTTCSYSSNALFFFSLRLYWCKTGVKHEARGPESAWQKAPIQSAGHLQLVLLKKTSLTTVHFTQVIIKWQDFLFFPPSPSKSESSFFYNVSIIKNQ